MNGIHLKISKPKDKLAAGSSRLLGNPDVWDDFEWPYIEENGEKYDLTFMCQINCAEAAVFDQDGLLPKTGMLYFFYDLDGMPETPDSRSAQVIWYNGDMSVLHEMVLTDEGGSSMAFAEQKIEFAGADADGEASHLQHGDILPDIIADRVCIKGWQALLKLPSIETEDAKICFKDGGMLCFYIEPDKLAAHDFSDVRAAQIRL